MKERLFRLLGYDALEEIKKRIAADGERRIILLVHFDNGKVAYCGNKELVVNTPSGAENIISIKIVSLNKPTNLTQLAIKVIDHPENDKLKGELGEAIINEKFMDEKILTKISEKSKIPKENLKAYGGEKGS